MRDLKEEMTCLGKKMRDLKKIRAFKREMGELMKNIRILKIGNSRKNIKALKSDCKE